MFMHFLNTLKKIAVSFLTFTLLMGVVGCKPSVEHFNVIYGDRVENMSSMFRNATVFNGDIGQWDVANVKNMSYMFFDAKKFNRPLADWDVSNVNHMTHIFNGATNFAQNISTWRISESIFLTDVYRKNMFDRSYLADKPHLQP